MSVHVQPTASSAQNRPQGVVQEKPQNGIAGLKHWRYDIPAGMVVSLISLPFSLGIAVASGAPPITGIISAIIAGFILPFLGGSYVTVSGPAAGLAPILLASMMVLGRGDLKTGYPILLVAICLAGLVQLVMAQLKLARLSAMFPAAVVEGMLCAIGLLIIVKQMPSLMGVKFHAHEFLEYFTELPEHISQTQPVVFLIGMLSLALMFALSACKAKWLKVVPPQVIAVIFGSALGLMFGLKGDALINIPANPLGHGFQWPNFAGVWNDSGLWFPVITTVITLTLIDGIESLATVMAIDKIDPFHRKSNPDRTLLAMGASNIVSSLAGGLTIIPGGVKSTACIMGGGRTQWANFYNACFLLVYLLLARPIINLMPFSVLAAMLIFTGYKLCRPKVWKHIAHIGWEQIAIFSITVIATLSTDLLWGIMTGIAAKFALTTWLHSTSPRQSMATVAAGPTFDQTNGPSWLGRMTQTFRNPVSRSESAADAQHVYFTGPLVSFNWMHVSRELTSAAANSKQVYLHVTDHVTLVDHTSCEGLLHFAEECERNGTARVEVLGLDRMMPHSEFPSCMRSRRRCEPAVANGSPRREELAVLTEDREVESAADLEREAVACATDGAIDASTNRDANDGLTWLSLSDPTATSAKGDHLGSSQTRARLTMDWLSLLSPSGGPVRLRDLWSFTKQAVR